MKNTKHLLTVFLCGALSAGACRYLPGQDDDTNSDLLTLGLLAVAASPRCAEFPQTVVHAGTTGSGALTCSVSGLVLSCTGGSVTIKYAYPSTTAARLSLFVSPLYALSHQTFGFRGTAIDTGAQQGTFTLDDQLHLTRLQSGAATITGTGAGNYTLTTSGTVTMCGG